ncbi:cobaltochelatase subunit CobN [Lampropedia puyangensis]|uniref:Cobaltochelatase subunit CobN n=1 Tax=Lampropedia puyangensis TaxID=1330072 RepID=A0A4S8EW02_9BURK|nr:cobaltochelatase subunit CobN [Lampropedia puyangensis]THT98716.1 cobaltochelatase subunit CobN [Lampropedia puyangensis]
MSRVHSMRGACNWQWHLCLWAAFALLQLAMIQPSHANTDDEATSHMPLVRVVADESILPGKLDKLRTYARLAGVQLESVYSQDIPGDTPAAREAWVSQADLLILESSLRGGRERLRTQLGPILQRPTVRWLEASLRSTAHSGLPAPHANALAAYYENGGEANYRHFFAYLRLWLAGQSVADVPAPILLPADAYYHPDARSAFTSFEDYLAWGTGTPHVAAPRWQQGSPRIAFAIHATSLANMQTGVIDAAIRRSEALGMLPVAFWFDGDKPQALTHMLKDKGIQVLINMQHMGNAEQRVPEIEQLGIPVLTTLNYRDGNTQSWREAESGTPSRMVAPFMAVYEIWGMTDPLVLSALEQGEPAAIPEQLDALLHKAKNLATLQTTPAADKRLALMFWNYPNGDRNISASNLNVTRSIERLLPELAKAGYQVPGQEEASIITQAQAVMRPLYDHAALDGLLEQGLADTLPLKQYLQWLQALPERRQQALDARWGDPASHWAIREISGEKHFIIPRIQWGNLTVLPQMPRSDVDGKDYHDAAVPPNHYYLANYLYLREKQKVHALIHFGTHGSQEWLPGKDRGVGADDYPFLAVGDIPVIYPYIQDNLGEAVQAKRRGRATIVSHQTPPFAPSALYDELVDLHALIHEYQQLEEGAVRERTRQQIQDAVMASRMDKDLEWDTACIDADFDGFFNALHDHLHQLANQNIPLGLHTFGQPASDEHRLLTVMQQLGEPLQRLADEWDRQSATQQHHGQHPHQAHQEHDHGSEPFAGSYEELAKSAPYRLLHQYLREKTDLKGIQNAPLRQMLERARELDHGLQDTQEIESLLLGLSGRYVPPGPGGDPVRNPGVPSGRNLYAFEPDKLPTRAAYDAAAEQLQSLIDDYRNNHDGQAPTKLAFSLWSVEAMRHLGMVESQILLALGLRPVWDEGGRVRALEIISREELGRGRIDAVVQVTGAYRDQFDGFMRLLAQAIDNIAQLPEADNAVAINSLTTEKNLLAQGLAAERAATLARARIFGNKPGDYGVGLADATLDSTSWEDDAPLAQQYLSRLQYAYAAPGKKVQREGNSASSNNSDWAIAVGDEHPGVNLYAEQLKGVQAAVLARSSNTYGLLSGDDPFQFLGGMSMAVRHLDGESPELYIADLRDPRTGRMTSAARFLADELRTRYDNPQWIGAMQQEGYAGTVNVLKVINNLWGWQVTDPGIVRDDQWQALHETYVNDQRELGINEWFEKHNPTAQAQLIERMMEAVRKGYWQASEQTQHELAQRWQQLVDQHDVDVQTSSPTWQAAQKVLAGFGMNAGAGAQGSAASPDASEPASSQETESQATVQSQAVAVQGQVMEQVQPAEPPPRWVFWLSLAALLLAAAAGATQQSRQAVALGRTQTIR